MPVPAAGVGYLRFLLRSETDGRLFAAGRPADRAASLPAPEEILALLKILITRGARRVRIGGDDPGLRTDLVDIVSTLSGLPGISSVALSSRGLGLVGRATDLARAGLRGVNFHLDTLRPARYAGGEKERDFEEVWKAVEECLAADLTVKLNVVPIRGINDDEIGDFVALTRQRPLSVRFVEWNVDTDLIPAPEAFMPTWETMAAMPFAMEPVEPAAHAGPAILFRADGHQGTVGFIPNVTDHFCSDCHRVGLTDAGEIVSCLFGRGLDVVRHLRATNGVAEAETFIDRVIRRKTSLSAKLAGWESPSAVVAASTPASSG